jgi:tetratricopeptide (TPR) repeat protein
VYLAFLRVKQGEQDMTSSSVSYISKTLLSILFAVCLVFAPTLVCAQEYTEEQYKAFQDIQAEKDPAAKTDLIVKFLKESPKNELRPNIVAEYQKIIIDLKNEKRWNQIIALGNKFIDAAPGDDFTENALVVAYAETENYKGFAPLAERVYARTPSTALAKEIARAYQKAGNDAKAAQWKEKVLAADPGNIEILADTMKKHAASQNTAQAVKYAKQCLSVLPAAKKPEGTADQAWKDTVNQTYAIAYGILGQDAYQNRRYAEAIRNLDSAVKYFKRNDAAYYMLGMCYLYTSKPQPAMLNFAKAYLIKGSVSSQAKQQLDKIWKDSHRGSLSGQNTIIERAQQDLK